MALLGKQGWNFITRLDALVIIVSVARYYPNGDFLSAYLGHNPSYAWRSIESFQIRVSLSGWRW